MIEITSVYLREQGLSETFEQRFWKKVEKTETCWLWVAHIDTVGYGAIFKGYNRNASPIRAHVASWLLHFGPIPKGRFVLHRCDNRACVNPDHLWLGTHADNMKDKRSNNRHTTRQRSSAIPESTKEAIRQSSESRNRLAAKFGVSEGMIYKLRHGA
jgi:hypothetical protein